MATRHLTFRINEAAFERLEAASRRSNQSRSELAKTLIDEGLKMDEHPGIAFRSGPGGRRPGLSGGPDVWEIVRVFKDHQAADVDAVDRVARLMSLTQAQVHTALRYYAEYQPEVDAWIERVDYEADEAENRWRRERKLLGR
jgi:hypothetical protein